MNPSLPQIAEIFLGHLVLEESTLQEARISLREVHEQLVGGNLEQMKEAIQRQALVAHHCEQVRQARLDVCSDLAHILELSPDGLSLSIVATRLPHPWADRVAAARDRLQALATEVERLHHRVATLVEYCRTFMSKLIADVTGGGTPMLRYYGRTGVKTESPRQPLLQARG